MKTSKKSVSVMPSIILVAIIDLICEVPLGHSSEIGGLHYVYWDFPLDTFGACILTLV